MVEALEKAQTLFEQCIRTSPSWVYAEGLKRVHQRLRDVQAGKIYSYWLNDRPLELPLPPSSAKLNVPLAGFGCEMPDNRKDLPPIPDDIPR